MIWKTWIWKTWIWKTWKSLVWIVLVVILVGCPQISNNNKNNNNKAPTINSFIANVENGTAFAPVEVQFTVEASDPNGDELSYSWDVSALTEEGNTSEVNLAEVVDESSNVLTFSFTAAGRYAVKVSVSDGKIPVDQTIEYEVMANANAAPEITALSSSVAEGRVPLQVDFVVEASDPDGDALSYLWDFGDEIATQTTAEGAEVSFTFEEVGLYTVSVTVTDGINEAVVETLSIDAQENQAPSDVTLIADVSSGIVPLSVNFQAEAQDANGDDLSYSWDFGDGREDDCFPNANCLHVFQRAGSFEVVVTASDGLLTTASDSLEIVVEPSETNSAPIINSFEVDQTNLAVPFTATFNVDAVDPDGNQLVYSWDFGDGTTIVDSNDVVQQHEYRSEGEFTASVSVSDGQFEDAKTVTVVALPNTDPVIEAFTVSANEGRVPTVINFEVDARDPDGQELQYFYDFGIAGQAEVEAGDRTSFTYAAAGTFTAKVRVFDGLASVSASQIIFIRSNAQPVIDSVTASTMEGPVPLEITFGVEASDADGDELLIDWDFGDNSSAQGATVSHTYSEIKDYVVTVSVSDQQAENNTATATLDIFVTSEDGNRRPKTSLEVRNLVSTATRSKVPATYQFGVNVIDGNSDASALSFTWDFGDGTTETITSNDGIANFQTDEGFNDRIEIRHVYEQVGDFQTMLTVSDGELETTTSFAPLRVLAPTYAGTYRWTAVNHPVLCNECQPFSFSGVMTIDREISQDDVSGIGGVEIILRQGSAGTGQCTENCNFGGVTFVGDINVLDTDTLGIMVSDALDLETGTASNIKLIAGEFSSNFLGVWEPVFDTDGNVVNANSALAAVTFERIDD